MVTTTNQWASIASESMPYIVEAGATVPVWSHYCILIALRDCSVNQVLTCIRNCITPIDSTLYVCVAMVP